MKRTSPPQDSPRSKPSGFTLIESLVVVGILAILIALVFPLVASMTKEASRAKCASQLRQTHGGIVSWNLDHNNRYIPAFSKISTNNGYSVWFRTYSSLADYLGGPDTLQKITVCPANLTNGPVGPPVNHSLGYPYVVNYNVMVPQSDGTGYSDGAWVRVASIQQPSKTVLMVDSQRGKGWVAAGFSANSSFARVAEPHAGKANILWCDGHVSSDNTTNIYNSLEITK